MKKALSLLAALTVTFGSYAQDRDSIYRPLFVGLGLGVDYGGIGTKVEWMLKPRISVFVGLGYNFVGLGVSGGFSCKLLTRGAVRPYLIIMGGYNAADVTHNATYYGATGGPGLDFFGRRRKNKFSLELLYAVRDERFIKDNRGASPLLVSLGINLRERRH